MVENRKKKCKKWFLIKGQEFNNIFLLFFGVLNFGFSFKNKNPLTFNFYV